MSKPSDGTYCEKCGKRLQFSELRYIVGRGFYLCLDCIPEPKPRPRWRAVPTRFQQCSICGCGIAANKERTVRIDPTRPHADDVVYCSRCVEWQRAGLPPDGKPCPTDTCGICNRDCSDDEECGEIRNGDRAVHVCSDCFAVWEYIRDMAAEGSGAVGGTADPSLTYGNEAAAQRPQELSAHEKRIGKLTDDAITGSGKK